MHSGQGNLTDRDAELDLIVFYVKATINNLWLAFTPKSI
jgi:hypothetical protein